MTIRPSSISCLMLRSLRTTGRNRSLLRLTAVLGLKGPVWEPISTHRETMANRNGDHQLKRIVLPSGKTIEVVYFESLTAEAETIPAEAPITSPQRGTQTDLHVCPECTSELVYPVAWEEADESHWSISLR